MIPNLERKIKKAIEEYMEDVNLNFLSDEDADSVKLAIDSEEITNNIYSMIKEHVFKFDSSPYGDQHCDSCQKMFADFVSENGAIVQADEILRPGAIIILD